MFYRSWQVFGLTVPAALVWPYFMRDTFRKQRQEELLLQFKDMVLSLAGCLNAGFSVENACYEALREMDRVYGKESMIVQELRLLVYKTHLNQTIGEALEDFAERSGLEDIKSFAQVFLEAKNNGGELMKIIARTAEIISEKIRIRQDILTASTSQRLEQKIMSMVPIGIVFYLEFASHGFFDVLYTTIIGRVIMTGCMVVYLGSIVWGQKILEIAV